MLTNSWKPGIHVLHVLFSSDVFMGHPYAKDMGIFTFILAGY